MTLKMANDFKNIYAVDLSDDMLMQAYEKFQEKGIDARVICQDMSELDLNHKFDLISCMLDSTNYILDEEDLRDYFKSVYVHLKDGGVFVFDINSYYKLSEIQNVRELLHLKSDLHNFSYYVNMNEIVPVQSYNAKFNSIEKLSEDMPVISLSEKMSNEDMYPSVCLEKTESVLSLARYVSIP